MCKKFIYFSFLILVLSITSASRADLVAYYGLDEGGGNVVSDGTGNGHDGQGNGALDWVDGQDGTALKFAGDGASYVNCGTYDPSGETGELTVSLWINYAGTNGAWQGIIGKRDAYAAGQVRWALEINNGNTQTVFSLQAIGWPRIYANHVPPVSVSERTESRSWRA